MQQIEGYIISGTGRGSKFISMPVYSDIFSSLLEALPYPGTLNIKLDEKYVEIVNRYFEIGTKFDNLSTNGKQTGGIIVNHFYLTIDDNDCLCIGVRPLLTEHHTDVLEIVSQHFLRNKLELQNNSRLTLNITEKL
ncbi:MAG: Riboflavin kinase [Candidatus Heimdallarchaeota archaeon LC_2]|nr:MAG: Riboflavin kinase [Candidatus Heimdallarchaeota archaeon LC_2]